MKVAFVIEGEPASKANSRKVVKFGSRSAMIKSDKARDYERDALKQIPPRARLRLEGPVRLTARIYYASERPDLDESLIMDILQDRYKRLDKNHRLLVQNGVIRNDRQIREKHIYWSLDKRNPRAEIEIETMAIAAQVELVLADGDDEDPF